MPPRASQTGRRSIPWSVALYIQLSLILARPHFLLPALVLCVLSIIAWSVQILDETNIRMSEDAALARFSDYCAAPGDGAEGALPQGSGLTLRDVVVFFGPGDVSPVASWEEEAERHWVCTPQPPDDQVHFKVVSANGSQLERDFAPDLLDRDGSLWCAPGQLTALGFRQMAGLGLHLSQAYAEQLNSAAELRVRSVDLKRTLASAVGLLITLLASTEAVQAFRHGAEVPIEIYEPVLPERTPPQVNSGSSVLDDAGSIVDQNLGVWQSMDLGDHLLSRWCHQVAWPCQGSPKKCISVQNAAEIVAKGEADMCKFLAGPDAPTQTPLLDVAKLPKEQGAGGTFALLAMESSALSSALMALLGNSVCVSPHAMRPPSASRFVFERWWDIIGGFRWRVLWNGADITDKVADCSAFPPGCDDVTMRRALLRHGAPAA